MKSLCLALLVTSAFSCHAGELGSLDLFTGPYISLGATNFIRNDILELSSLNNGITFFRAYDHGNVVGLSLLGGYRRQQAPFILNGNVAFRYIPGVSEGVVLNAINTPRVSSYTNLGLEVRPGVLVTPQVAISGILGLETAHYQVGYQFNSTIAQFSGWQVGPGFGLGIDVALSPHLIMQLDYLYVYYSALHYIDVGNAAKVNFQPSINMLTIALNYRF